MAWLMQRVIPRLLDRAFDGGSNDIWFNDWWVLDKAKHRSIEVARTSWQYWGTFHFDDFSMVWPLQWLILWLSDRAFDGGFTDVWFNDWWVLDNAQHRLIQVLMSAHEQPMVIPKSLAYRANLAHRLNALAMCVGGATRYLITLIHFCHFRMWINPTVLFTKGQLFWGPAPRSPDFLIGKNIVAPRSVAPPGSN